MVRTLRGQTTIEALQRGILANEMGAPTKHLWVPDNQFPLPAATSSVGVFDTSEGSLRQRFQQHLGLDSPHGAAFPLLPHERVYDVGTRGNLQAFWAIPLLGITRASP